MPPTSSRTSTAHSRGPTSLPPYQPPTAPLNPTALLALQSLPQSHPLTSLSKRQTTAYTHLCDLAGEINDRYQTRAANAAKRRERRAAQGLSDDDEAEEKITQMKDVTETMTTKMEAAVRRVVDERARVEATETALQELDTNLRDGSGRLAPTQSTLGASQFRSRRGADPDSDADDSTQQEGPTSFLKRKLETAETDHDGRPARAKYAADNDYIAFRRILHDATHPGDDAPPLPHASTWFPDRNSTTHTNNDPTSDDEDIQIASEKRSIRCPLTLLPMRDPLSSTKCPHAFEKEAILGMLAASELRLHESGDITNTTTAAGRRRGGENTMRCPECQVLLTAGHLLPDPALARKVKRVLARERERARGEEEDEDEDEDEDEGGGSVLQRGEGRREEEGRRIKAERAASRGVSMVPNSQAGRVGEGEEEIVGETQLSAEEEEEEEE